MACRLDEVYASVDAVVHNIHPIDLVLGLEIRVKSLLDILYDWAPRVVIVDKVAKAGCVNHCQS